MSHLFTGNIRQSDDLGTLKGDLCLAETWEEAKASGEVAWLDGRTNGRKFDMKVSVGDTEYGALSYKKLPFAVNGLIAYGELTIGDDKHTIAVFSKSEFKLSLDEDTQEVTSVEVKYHSFKVMTPDELAKYAPKKAVSRGSLM